MVLMEVFYKMYWLIVYKVVIKFFNNLVEYLFLEILFVEDWIYMWYFDGMIDLWKLFSFVLYGI